MGERVVLDEAGVVRITATLLTKPVFDGRERAYRSGELGPRAPRHRGEVHPSNLTAPKDEQAPEEYEGNEGDMEDNRGVGEDAEDHYVAG